jgi:hypothetical protein
MCLIFRDLAFFFGFRLWYHHMKNADFLTLTCAVDVAFAVAH